MDAYRLGASVEYGSAVEVLVVLDGVAVLDDAFGATVVGRGATVAWISTSTDIQWA